jgi:hypothetical protein
MIALLTAKFVSLGLGERGSRIVAGVVAALSLFALCAALGAIWLHLHDRAVVREHEAGIVAAVAAATSSAEAVADANDQLRASERAADDQDLRKAIDHAGTSEPERVRGAAGPAVNAVAERLRRQREAGHAGP